MDGSKSSPWAWVMQRVHVSGSQVICRCCFCSGPCRLFRSGPLVPDFASFFLFLLALSSSRSSGNRAGEAFCSHSWHCCQMFVLSVGLFHFPNGIGFWNSKVRKSLFPAVFHCNILSLRQSAQNCPTASKGVRGMGEAPRRERKCWDWGKALVNTIQGCQIFFSHKCNPLETDLKFVVPTWVEKFSGVTHGRPIGLLYLKQQLGTPGWAQGVRIALPKQPGRWRGRQVWGQQPFCGPPWTHRRSLESASLAANILVQQKSHRQLSARAVLHEAGSSIRLWGQSLFEQRQGPLLRKTNTPVEQSQIAFSRSCAPEDS